MPIMISGRGSKRKKTSPSDELALQMAVARLPPFIREYYFAKPRMWRFDFAFTNEMLAVEVEGGIWNYRHGGKSRHTTGKGFEGDCRKYARATVLGWRLLRFTPGMITSGEALSTIEEALREV